MSMSMPSPDSYTWFDLPAGEYDVDVMAENVNGFAYAYSHRNRVGEAAARSGPAACLEVA